MARCVLGGGMLFVIHRFLCVYVVDCVFGRLRVCLFDRCACWCCCVLRSLFVVCVLECRDCVFYGLSDCWLVACVLGWLVLRGVLFVCWLVGCMHG